MVKTDVQLATTHMHALISVLPAAAALLRGVCIVHVYVPAARS
jgi:hypothetical protein